MKQSFWCKYLLVLIIGNGFALAVEETKPYNVQNGLRSIFP